LSKASISAAMRAFSVVVIVRLLFFLGRLSCGYNLRFPVPQEVRYAE